MEVIEVNSPREFFYDIENQMWAKVCEDNIAIIGITELGIRLAGEVYMCRPKKVSTLLNQGDGVGIIELSKSVVSIKTPVSGEIIEINNLLEDAPENVHKSPYENGWIAKIRLSDFENDLKNLITGDNVEAAMQHHAWLNRKQILPKV